MKTRTDILTCCGYLAESEGEPELSAAIQQLTECVGPTGKKETLENIIGVARQAGVQTLLLRPQPGQWAEVAVSVPMVAELRDGRYLIVSDIETGSEGVPVSVTTLSLQDDGGRRKQKFNLGFRGQHTELPVESR